VKKQDVLALLADLPDEFDADQLLYTLSLQYRLERAESDLAAGRLTPNGERESLPDLDRKLWEAELAYHRRKIKILSRAFDNKELMDQVYDGLQQIRRGVRGTPLRDLQKRRKTG
jgi:hypothetical protein